MRLLLINYEFPPLGGGAGNATANIAKEMAAQDHTVFVITSRYGQLPHEESPDGYTIIRIPARRKAQDRSNPIQMLAFILSSIWHVIALNRRIKPEYSIAFFGIPSAPAAWVLKAIFGVPYIVSLRGGDVPGFQPYDLKNFHRITKPIIQFLWWQSQAIVANSEGLKQLAQQSAPRRQINIIPNGVDLDYFSLAEKTMGKKLLFVGRLRYQKGLSFLIDAFSQLDSEDRARLSIYIVGDGPDKEKLAAQINELGLTSSFTFMGWVERVDIAKTYQAHDIFILPSLDEGMPNVILEAIACGLPVITTNISGSQELVNKRNGWLVPPANADALASALKKVASLTEEDYHQRSAASRAIAESYSWKSIANQYLQLISSQREN